MKKLNQRLYVSPQVEVIEAEMQAVICQSTTNTSLGDMNETNMDINY